MAPFKTSSTQQPSSNLPVPISSASQQNESTEPISDFSARRSGRVASGQLVADNDTWVEALAVCEVAKDAKKANTSKSSSGLLKKLKSKSNSGSSKNLNSNIQQQQHHEAEMSMAAQRLTLRPYFQSQNTGQRVWDEPPSGASNIVYVAVNARKMAQAQLEEMRSTYAQAALVRKFEKEEANALHRSSSGVDRSFSRKLSLATFFNRSSNSTSETEGRSMSTPLVASSKTESARTGIPQSVLEESINLAPDTYDQDLQMAMILSMGIGKGSVMGVGDIRGNDIDVYSEEFASTNNCTQAAAMRREREQIEMAKALSLAEEKTTDDPTDDIRQGKSNKSGTKNATLQYFASLKHDDPEINSQQPTRDTEQSVSLSTMYKID